MKSINLEKDHEFSIVLKLALPAMLGQLLNVLYNIIDRIFISSLPSVGDLALSGMGVCAPIVTLITSFSFLIGLGGAPLMSIALGAKNQKRAKDILANSLLSLFIISLTITLLFYAFKTPLLYGFGASEKSFEYANEYLSIYLFGAIFSTLAMGLNQFIISQGFSKQGMMTLSIGATINILLDALFILVFNLGIKGAALATVIAQMLSFIYAFTFLLSKKTNVKISFTGYSMGLIKEILKLGLSPFIIWVTDPIILIVLNACLKKYGGVDSDIYICSATIASSFYQLASMPLLGISSGTGSLLSYNYGSGNYKRIIQGEKYILLSGIIFTSICFILSFIVQTPFIRIFTSDPKIIEASETMIRYYFFALIPLSFQYCIVDGLTALGFASKGIIISLFRKITIFVLTFVLPIFMGIYGCFLSETIADILAPIVAIVIGGSFFKKIILDPYKKNLDVSSKTSQ